VINYFNRTLKRELTHQFNRSVYVVFCCQRTTTRLTYKMWPLSNLPSNVMC